MVNARPPAASTSEQHLQALHVLKTHAFIHIPKTGGTTIEALAPGQFSVYKQTQDCCKLGGNPSVPIALKWCCKPASPWHMVPDLLPRYLNRTVYRLGAPRWCIVRHPADRWESCVAWSRGPRSEHLNGTWFGHPATPPAELLRTFSDGRHSVQEWTEELVHRQPQHWYVWDEHGGVQCDCVVAFEKLGTLTDTRKKASAHADTVGAGELPAPLQLLYKMDAHLWRLAQETDQFCFRPTSRTQTLNGEFAV
jgi:hypothetical protein